MSTVEIDLIHKGIKTSGRVSRVEVRVVPVEIDLIHKGIKTAPAAVNSSTYPAVEIDLIHKGIKTKRHHVTVLQVTGERRNRPDS